MKSTALHTTSTENETNAYLESLSAELDAAGLSPALERPPNFGITIREYMAKGYTEPVTRRTLERAVQAGALVRHAMRDGMGGHPIVYCRPGEYPPK